MIDVVNKIQNIKESCSRAFYIVDKNCYKFNKEKMNFIDGKNIFLVTSIEKNKTLAT